MDAGAHRNSKGQFGPGNPGGPGGSRPRRSLLRQAAEDAISPDHVGGLVRKLTMLGLGGNVTAAKAVLDHTCGRAPDAPADSAPLNVTLPNLTTAVSCTGAIDKIISAITAGTVDLPTAKFLLDAVERRRKAIETVEHEEKIKALEQAVESVDLTRNRQGR